jgi:hypothetical protein
MSESPSGFLLEQALTSEKMQTAVRRGSNTVRGFGFFVEVISFIVIAKITQKKPE